MRRRLAIAAIAACAASLALPAGASALMSFEVNSTGDGPDKTLGSNGCETATASECTLRAAIEEANFNAGADEIKFSAAFDGKLADTISPATNLPEIAESVHIDGDKNGQCTTEAAAAKGPCVGVDAAGGTIPLTVKGDNVTIEGLAVTGGLEGIRVINATEHFTAKDDWLGVKLDGSAAGSFNTAIFIDPGSNLATIGGPNASDRNVIANSLGDGLDILGAGGTVVQGNYFGVKPDGSTPAPNGKDLEITDTTAGGGIEAVGTVVGAPVGIPGIATAECDRGCNVFASSSTSEAAIDLKGNGGEEVPASGPTTISGNYIGLDAAGVPEAQGADKGILVGGADKVLIGGTAVGAGNNLNRGTFGVLAGTGADDLAVAGNLIGLDPSGSEMLAPPSADGIFDSSEGISGFANTAEIFENRIAMSGGVPIEQHSIGALIAENVLGRGVQGKPLSAGETGIKLWGSTGGSLVEANLIENASSNGVLIENDNDELVGNTILGSGAAGIRVQNFLTLPTTGTAIGGDTPESENLIAGSGGDAIEVADEEDDDTQIRRNSGGENEGLYIDLGADGPGNDELTGPNDGIQAPAVGKATTSGISGGGALPGAEIRVFEKAGAEPGEIKAFLGKTEADGVGGWELAYGANIPGGTNVGVTQSGFEGTSELAQAVTEPDKAGGGEAKGGGNNGGGGGGGGTQDKTPPQTTIRKGPKGKTHSSTAKFKFVSSEAGSSFQCKLDRGKFKSCRSPRKLTGLKPGKHVFRVRAKDAAGNVDPTPAKRAFTVLG